MKRLRGLCLGAGYFSQFHFDAWRRIGEVEIVGICDTDRDKVEAAAATVESAAVYDDPQAALAQPGLDFIDIITPPATHLALVEQAAKLGLAIICQKPLAPDFGTAAAVVEVAEKAGVRLMVHENFRFQPWHREIRRLLDQGAIGHRLHNLYFRSRPGDGWGPDAYLARQPYFQEMPRFLVHETGIHFIDTFRYLAGEVIEAYAVLRRLNPAITGEDTGMLTFRFESGAVGVWDAGRCNESTAEDPRYTFGEFLVEADGGSIRLYPDGRLTIQPRGKSEVDHDYHHEHRGFGGDCVYTTQRHFIDRLQDGGPFETGGREYIKNLLVEEALYDSARRNRPIRPSGTAAAPRGRIVDLSLPISDKLRGAAVSPAKTIARDGWNATTLTLYSHCGTHMDAPHHFVEGSATIDEQDLSVCCGLARVLDLTPVQPRELLGVDRLARWASTITSGDRLLLRTDWHKRLGTDAYRDELPRISTELAEWLVERRVALVGVEPPSVADVNDIQELTAIHQILFRGGVTIVEGLANLDQLTSSEVEFIALPLNVIGGDGTPVRAIAIEGKL
jgi:predicted dehydrogenase/kynurenine formamidase